MMNQNVTDLQEQLARVCAERDALLYTNKALGRLERIVEDIIESEMLPAQAMSNLRVLYGEYRAALGDS